MKQIPPSDTRNQSGFGTIEVLIIILVILLLICSGWFVWHHHKDTAAASTTKTHAATAVSATKAASSSSKSSSASTGKTTTTATSVPKTSASTGPVACSSSNLQLSLGQVSNAAGTSYFDAILTNTSGSTCTLNGYPVVQLGDGQGNPIGSAASNDTNATPSTVTLASNQTAHTVVGVPNPGFFSPSQCSASSTYILVTLPGNTVALKAAYSNQSCPNFSVTAITSGE
jgi:hypothetical protein